MIYTKETIDYILDEHKDEVKEGIIIISKRDAVDLADNDITEENLEYASFDGTDDEYTTAGYELAGCMQEKLDGNWLSICREDNLEMWNTDKWTEDENGSLRLNQSYAEKVCGALEDMCRNLHERYVEVSMNEELGYGIEAVDTDYLARLVEFDKELADLFQNIDSDDTTDISEYNFDFIIDIFTREELEDYIEDDVPKEIVNEIMNNIYK